jgi:APA family basic amino acid/polyamine antiporter
LLPLVLIGCVGLLFVETENLPVMHPGEGNALIVFASVFALTFWNFLGIESATVPAEDTVNSGNTIARATVIGTLTVGMVYLLVNFVALGVLPTEELAASTSPLSDVGIRLIGGIGGVIVVVGALVSTAGCINTTLLAAGQMAMAAARDGLFPGLFARISTRHAPAASYVLSGMLASLLLLLNFAKGLVAAYTFILLIATLTTVIPYAFSAISSLILQNRDPSISRAHRLREGGVAAIAFGVCMWVIAASGFETVYWGFLLLMAGLPVYVLVTRVKPAGDHRPD